MSLRQSRRDAREQQESAPHAVHREMVSVALGKEGRDALREAWTAKKATVYRLALMGFISRWWSYVDCPGFNLELSDKGQKAVDALTEQVQP